MNGGRLIAQTLDRHGVRYLFTLCGGHISPILVEAERLGVRVVDVRHEADAVFAADAVARLSGVPGVAAVTAGPGCTNTITAVKNAQLAQSPVVILGGATATMLKGRGSLQDIDQMACVKPFVKWATAATNTEKAAARSSSKTPTRPSASTGISCRAFCASTSIGAAARFGVAIGREALERTSLVV